MNDKTTKNVIAAFTEEQVERLTGVTVRQLRTWDRTKFFVPSLAYEDRSRPYARLYSFRDLACLKVLNALRNESSVSLQHLREVKKKLAHLGDDAWAKTTLYVLNKKVIFDNPETKSKEEIVSGQGILQIPLKVVTGELQSAVDAMRRRDESSVGKIERKRGTGAAATISGTRIPVSAVKAFSDAGYSIDEILKEYPTLDRNDVIAAINYVDAA
ncbi:MAG TPA: DUF433 domain-containing protein [Ensifer sp.]|uniref:DUF433 domain-containing protein n=1 Tax=Ensifer sp. TaxID=1872086 RepID=UPI002E1271C9|nr:DUF433 domain-containing protein [Ensifer sp.]